MFDEIEIEFNESKKLVIDVVFNKNELNNLVPLAQNLAYRAVDLYLKQTGLCGSCKIRINKNIPLEAGLGGGSSNAACVLMGLNKILNALSPDEILILSGKLGSDVPFFVLGGTCSGRGRGEILQSLENKLNLDIKIIKPEKISISTKWAYELMEMRELLTDRSSEINSLIKAMADKDQELFFKNLFNDFEQAVFSCYPGLINERNKLLNEGYKYAGLCGSGSGIFGIK